MPESHRGRLELIQHVKILVKDSAKKQQTSNELQRAERDDRSDIVEPLSPCYPSQFP